MKKEKLSEPLTLPPCRVCGGTATGIHYGVNTCEACKAFFRRSLVEKNKYVCPRNGDCKIINHKRANCSACRLKKCLELGMSKKAVRHGRYTVAIRTKTILEVKQLEREQALKDSFAIIDAIAGKLPEIISVPDCAQETQSTSDNPSSRIEISAEDGSDISSLMESSFSNNSIQSMSMDATLTSTQSAADENKSMTSLEPPSLFSSVENHIGSDIFQRMDSFDILNAIELDIASGQENIDISGSEEFLDQQQHTAETVELDLTSDSIDFLEINPGQLLTFGPGMPIQDQSSRDNMVMVSNIPHKTEPTEDSPDTTTTTDESAQYPYTNETELSPGSIIQIPETDFSIPSPESIKSRSPPPHKKLRASYNALEDLEQLQTINTLVTAQEILYPEMRKYFNKEYTDVIHREFVEKTQLHAELFGQLKSLSTAEYNNFFLVTGIDIDGRIGMFTKAAECMQKEIVRYISFVKSIPGWENVHNSDKLTLIKASRFEYWLLGKYLQINPEMGITANEKCGFTHKQILQMWGSPDNLATINSFTRKIKKLDLTFEEIAMMRGIVVLSRDRCILREPERIEKMQWNVLQSFIMLQKKTHPMEPLRFARCMDKIAQLRELTELNYKANKNLENFQKSLIQNYPLLYECLTFEG